MAGCLEAEDTLAHDTGFPGSTHKLVSSWKVHDSINKSTIL